LSFERLNYRLNGRMVNAHDARSLEFKSEIGQIWPSVQAAAASATHSAVLP